jgi:transposase
MMENMTDWRTEANVTQIARETGVAHNLIFKWLRL